MNSVDHRRQVDHGSQGKQFVDGKEYLVVWFSRMAQPETKDEDTQK